MKDGQCPSCGCYQPDNLLCQEPAADPADELARLTEHMGLYEDQRCGCYRRDLPGHSVYCSLFHPRVS